MKTNDLARLDNLLNLLEDAPTAWHATSLTAKLLEKEGYTPLNEGDAWKLAPGGKYTLTRNGSTLAAFIMPKKAPTSVRLMGSHTDSPGLKIKPNADSEAESMAMVGVEVYGGPLLSSWLNRDLAVAGRVAYEDKKGKVQEKLVHFQDSALVIPQLAIHLDRGVNEQGPKINKQTHLPALAAVSPKTPKGKGYVELMLNKAVGKGNTVLAFDLFLVPLEAPRQLGSTGEILAAYRIDNIGSMHATVEALIDAKPDAHAIKMLVAWDNEEIGSSTAQGAGSPFASNVIERIVLAGGGSREDYLRLVSQSLCVSIDVAHAWHPSYSDKYEPQHKPVMGEGIVWKVNAGQKHMSEATGGAHVAQWCKKAKVNLQRAVNRGDQPGGSTIGPIHATATGMPTVDIGYGVLSMHSIRELCSVDDHLDLIRVLDVFMK